MRSILEFLAQRLNNGSNPIGYYCHNPSFEFDSQETADNWAKFVRKLDSGGFVSHIELLQWIQVFTELCLADEGGF